MTHAAFAYLTAWTFAASLALGALIYLLVAHAMGARWTVLFQRRAEAIAGALPVIAVLFVPIAVWAPALYPWLHPPPVDPDLAVRAAHRAAWLNRPFWTGRAAIYLLFWVIAGETMRRWPTRALASALIIPVGLTLTFASFDWLMSLEPDWISTVYGLVFFAGGFVGALALIAATSQAPPAHTRALARLIFGFLIFWAYVEFAQGFIIWIANKPEEVPWYVRRSQDGWGVLFTIVVLGGFVFPFFALLGREPTRNARWVAAVGLWLVGMTYLDTYWLVMPAHGPPAPSWIELAITTAVLGIVSAVAYARRPPPFARDDPHVTRSLTYRGND